MEELIRRLHSENCSCVIKSGGKVECFHRRGVADLYHLLCNRPQLLADAAVADKVVGKGAAALMVKGGVATVYADVMSRAAIELLSRHGVANRCATAAEQIQNRTHTGRCPVETLTDATDDIDEMIALIARFVESQRQNGAKDENR